MAPAPLLAVQVEDHESWALCVRHERRLVRGAWTRTWRVAAFAVMGALTLLLITRAMDPAWPPTHRWGTIALIIMIGAVFVGSRRGSRASRTQLAALLRRAGAAQSWPPDRDAMLALAAEAAAYSALDRRTRCTFDGDLFRRLLNSGGIAPPRPVVVARRFTPSPSPSAFAGASFICLAGPT